MTLDRWVQHGNCLVGYLFGDRSIPNGTRVITEAVRFIDILNFEAECLDGKFRLGDPGTYEEHNNGLIGDGSLNIDESVFLNPGG